MEELNKIDITGLIPQRRPFVMIDVLKYYDELDTITSLLIRDYNIFVENGYFTEPGIIENIAQTGAARMGYINKYINKDNIRIGFIGEIKNMTILSLPKVNDEIITTITVTNEVLSTLLVKATVMLNNELICYGNLKITMT